MGVNSKLNLEVFNQELKKTTRPSNVLNVALRNCNSNKTKTRRTKIVCLTWPNTEKLNKNLRKPKRDPNWLKLKSPPSNPFKEWSLQVPLSPIPIKIQKHNYL